MNQLIQAELNDGIKHIKPDSVMALIVDPPYGYAQTKGMGIKGVQNPAWDTVRNADAVLRDSTRQASRVLHDDGLMFIFTPFERIPQTMEFMETGGLVCGGVAVWDKINSRPKFTGLLNSVEFIVWGHKMGAKPRPTKKIVKACFSKFYQQKGKWHPTPKPVELIKWLLSAAHDGLVADLCAGTCSTAHAAQELGRPWIMIEREYDYVNKASQDLAVANILHEVIKNNDDQ